MLVIYVSSQIAKLNKSGIMIIIVSLARSKDYIPGRQSAHGGAKKYIAIFHDWRYIYTWLAQFVNLLPRRGAPGSVLAPTRFSEAHAVPDIARIMEQSERRTRGRCVPANFHRKCLLTSSQFFRCVQEIWSALDRMFEDLCALYIYNTSAWIALFEFSDGQNMRNYPRRSQEFLELWPLKRSFWDERKENN